MLQEERDFWVWSSRPEEEIRFKFTFYRDLKVYCSLYLQPHPYAEVSSVFHTWTRGLFPELPGLQK